MTVVAVRPGAAPPTSPALLFNWLTQIESQLRDSIIMATVMNLMTRFRGLQLLVKKVALPAAPKPPLDSVMLPRKNLNFKSCASRGVRHSYSPYIHSIPTPGWTTSPPSDLAPAPPCGLHHAQDAPRARGVRGTHH
jgi:hypothetical protein